LDAGLAETSTESDPDVITEDCLGRDTGWKALCLEIVEEEIAGKADFSEDNLEDDKDPEATILDIAGVVDSFSFSSSLALLGWSSGFRFGLSLVTVLVMDRGRLPSMALRALSVEGVRAFTGDTMAEAVSLTGEGVETVAGAALAGVSLDFSLRESASLSNSLSALPLFGLLPGLPTVMG
jgi:hypothetical protein